MAALILSTILSIVSVHSSVIGKQIIKWLNRPSQKEKQLVIEKNNLKLEQSKVSLIDSFAKYSKIQRKINLIDQDLTEQRNEKNSIVLHVGLTYGLKIILGLLLLVLSIYYRYTPVFQLDSRIDLTPLSYMISYPNANNQVSFHFWVLCCSSIARLIKI